MQISQAEHDELKEVFANLKKDRTGFTLETLVDKLEEGGISKNDPRTLGVIDRYFTSEGEIDEEKFLNLMSQSELVRRALLGKLIIPDFAAFRKDVEEIFDRVKENTEGEVDESLPEPGQKDPPAFAVSICTIDGQLLQLGDHELFFTLQSICKPVNYAIAFEENGEEKLQKHVGVEPGKENFDVGMVLNERDLPHNPMINSGAMMCASLIKPDTDNQQRLQHVMEFWKKLCGGREIRFNEEGFEAEMSSSAKNYALAYLMEERAAFPENTDLDKTMAFYNQCCSIELSIDALAHAAASMANFGVCPSTGERIFQHSTVTKMLSIMLSSGMYDHSGEFAYWVGMPAKSGIAGGLMVVIPGLLGFSVYSPPLDEHGNSVRGVEFCEELVKKFNFHMFDSKDPKVHGKKDPRF